MEAARQQLYDVVREIPPNRLGVLLEFALYLQQKQEDDFSDLLHLCAPTLAFWDNEEDEVWNLYKQQLIALEETPCPT
ncbi:MAG: hypothetical protein FWD06_08575 [Oscillospiraceae bacterium]|nr:hypothetical protein [Oscillospiraceae bacterium]